MYRVAVGDVIGTHYDAEEDKGVVTYAVSWKAQNTIPNSELSRIILSKKFDKDFADNYLLEEAVRTDNKKMPSLMPVMSSGRLSGTVYDLQRSCF